MRYSNWDVILFPRDSPVPIQEFKTACYTSESECVWTAQPLPTLACYIASQPPSTPFRISVHSWIAPVKPSPAIESCRKPNERVVFTAQVLVDGSRVYHGYYEIETQWPKEIVNAKPAIRDPNTTSQHGSFLEFPPFRFGVLGQYSWNARENAGRIKFILSEQLVRNRGPDLELGASNHVVCFTFQHAPRGILEQAGIAWPILNPLFLPLSQRPEWPPSSHHFVSKSRDFSAEPTFIGVRNGEPHTRSRTGPPPRSSQWPRPSEKDFGMGTWDACFAGTYEFAPYSKPSDPWAAAPFQSKEMNETLRKHPSQVLVSFRDDQLDQIIEAVSPSKKQHRRSSLISGTTLASKMQTYATRSSAAALSRKSSYQGQNPKTDNKLPTGPPQEPRIHDPYQDSNEIFTSLSFMPRPDRKDSDVSMRDPSSIFSPVPVGERSSPAQLPSAQGNIQSRKEGHSGVPPTLDAGQLRSLLPDTDLPKSSEQHFKGNCINANGAREERDFVPGHKGMSSVDSTVRLERQLFSALGEELSGFNEEVMEDTRVMPLADDFSTPASKRKRQGTTDDRDGSPLCKVAREDDRGVSHSRGEI
ncbi:unnamed protein product [Periconia digitata]|uniref:Uncharacterized protein n=1 Tax=Periconia digitata TaxID=1303443 RepID=A0A9W4XVF1_9PLEO|nr:unnamed protein product [Periconia digitata]